MHDPIPADYLPLPTHPVRLVEYRLAARWDQEFVHVSSTKSGAKGAKGAVAAATMTIMPLRKAAEERREQEVRRRKRMATTTAGAPAGAAGTDDDHQHQHGRRPYAIPAASEYGHGRGHVSRELRDKAKHRPFVKGLVRGLEEPVRRFLMERETANKAAEEEEAHRSDTNSSSSEEDDEVVFVGRNGSMRNAKEWKRARREIRAREGSRLEEAKPEEGIVFDAPEDGDSAFKYAFRPPSVGCYAQVLTASQTLSYAQDLGVLRAHLQVC